MARIYNERSVRAMLKQLEARKIGNNTDGNEDWETNKGIPFELMAPHGELKPVDGPRTGYYFADYVEHLRNLVKTLSQKAAPSPKPKGKNHFDLEKKS